MSSRFDVPVEASLEKPPYYDLVLCKGEIKQTVGQTIETFRNIGGMLIRRNSVQLSEDTFMIDIRNPGAAADMAIVEELKVSLITVDRLGHELYSIGGSSIDYFGTRMLIRYDGDIPEIVPSNYIKGRDRMKFKTTRTVGSLCQEVAQHIDEALDRAYTAKIELRSPNAVREPLQDFSFFSCVLAELNVVGARSVIRHMRRNQKPVIRPIPHQAKYSIRNYLDGRPLCGSS